MSTQLKEEAGQEIREQKIPQRGKLQGLQRRNGDKDTQGERTRRTWRLEVQSSPVPQSSPVRVPYSGHTTFRDTVFPGSNAAEISVLSCRPVTTPYGRCYRPVVARSGP
ncbi:unnamed protein product [Calypogeia fissa]